MKKKLLLYFLNFLCVFFGITGAVAQESAKKTIVSFKHGPNCFNWALIKAGLYKKVRFVSADEFNTVVSSQYCIRKGMSKQKYGDILAYKRNIKNISKNNVYAHAMTVKTNKHYFSKHTFYMTSQPEVTTKAVVDLDYARTPSILRFDSMLFGETSVACVDEDCNNTAIVFECENYSGDLKKFNPQLYEDYSELEKKIEKYVTHISFSDQPFLLIQKQIMQDDLDALTVSVDRHCSQEANWFCGFYQKALSSIKLQLQVKQPQMSWYIEQGYLAR